MNKKKKKENNDFSLSEFNDDYINEISSEIYRFNILPYPDEQKIKEEKPYENKS